MATEEMVKAVAGLLDDAITTKRRDSDNKQIRVLKDGSPEWMTDAVREAGHEEGRFLPNDVLYAMIETAAGALRQDYEDDYLEASVDENDWYTEVPDAEGWVDQAMQDFGWPKEGGIRQAISMGLYVHQKDIFFKLRQWIEENIDTIREGSPDLPLDCYNCGKEYPQSEMYEDNFVSAKDWYCRECVLDIAVMDLDQKSDPETNFSAATIAKAVQAEDAAGEPFGVHDTLREWLAGQPATK